MLRKILFFILFLCFSCKEVEERQKKLSYFNQEDLTEKKFGCKTIWFDRKEEMLEIIKLLEDEFQIEELDFFRKGLIKDLKKLLIEGREEYFKEKNMKYSINKFFSILVKNFREPLNIFLEKIETHNPYISFTSNFFLDAFNKLNELHKKNDFTLEDENLIKYYLGLFQNDLSQFIYNFCNKFRIRR